MSLKSGHALPGSPRPVLKFIFPVSGGYGRPRDPEQYLSL